MGQNENCSLGDSTSNSSERLLQRWSGRRSTNKILVNVEVNIIQHSFSLNLGSNGKESAFNAGDLGLILGWKDPLEMGMATHSSILAWRNPLTEELSRLQSMCLQSWTYLATNTLQRTHFKTLTLQKAFFLVMQSYCHHER